MQNTNSVQMTHMSTDPQLQLACQTSTHSENGYGFFFLSFLLWEKAGYVTENSDY